MPRILLIDDEKLQLRIRACLLKMNGYEVVATANGNEAVALFSEQHFDLVITDWLMPVTTGLDIARQLKSINNNIPIILLAGFGRSFNKEQLRQEGVDYLLSKPCRAEQLLELIEKVLGPFNFYQYEKKAA